jgi:membrane glycosyltransferase
VPVVGALTLSIPISVYSSRISLGRALRRAGLLLIPEETDAPRELRLMTATVKRAGRAPGFIDAVVDPRVNAIACTVAPSHTNVTPRAEARRERAVVAALRRGPAALTDQEKRRLLSDPLALAGLHAEVWRSPDVHPGWLAGRVPGLPPALLQAS